MEHQHVVEPTVRRVERREHVERARRRRVVVELGIALVEDDEKIVAARGLDRDRCISPGGITRPSGFDGEHR